MMQANSHQEWADVYKRLIFWEMQLENTEDNNLSDILEKQKEEANIQFSKFVEKNYENWINNDEEAPLFSHKLFVRRVVPELRGEDNRSEEHTSELQSRPHL